MGEEGGEGGADGVGDQVPGGVGVASDVGVGEDEDGDELDDFVEGAKSDPHECSDAGEGECAFGAEELAGRFIACDGR